LQDKKSAALKYLGDNVGTKVTWRKCRISEKVTNWKVEILGYCSYSVRHIVWEKASEVVRFEKKQAKF